MARKIAANKFSVVLAKSAGGTTHVQCAQRMVVNHRGDLIFTNSVSPYGADNLSCVAVFRSGSWLSAIAIADDEPSTPHPAE